MSAWEVRFFEPERDYAMVAEWHHGHGQTAPPAAMLPRLGVIVTNAGEDIAGLWLYMDNSVGVCFAEHAVTRPGWKMGEAREALLLALSFLRCEAHILGYGLMLIHTLPAFARVLSRAGLFAEVRRNKVTMIGGI